jgi:UDP-3-O-acyl N-acetylglucosamine deacetylase
MRRKTLKNSVSAKGIALHSGRQSTISFYPTQEGTGIVFVRADLPSRSKIHASAQNVCDTKRGTTLKEGGATIAVVEHILAAVYCLGISDIVIEVDNPEPPAFDGSALPVLSLLKEAGTTLLNKEYNPIKPVEEIILEQGVGLIRACPSDRLRISFMVDFPGTVIGRQEISLEIDERTFEREIAPARTFGFMEEIESLKKAGLALGASLGNALAITAEGYVNKPRFRNEVVRHKVLDVIGDLALVGHPISAHIIAERSGHGLNTLLASRLSTEAR